MPETCCQLTLLPWKLNLVKGSYRLDPRPRGMKMDRRRLRCFSRGGDYLATCSSEGELKVWGTKQNSLQHTLVPSSGGAISCVSWSRVEEVRLIVLCVSIDTCVLLVGDEKETT